MTQQAYSNTFGGSAPENYERYFVPTIGGPLAKDLLGVAALRPGERILDVACGTGVVTRLAREAIGAEGSVAGLDVNPGMLAVARSVAPVHHAISWYESSAEAIPLSDDSFDVVLCQMGLQFIPDKVVALEEMHRVLAPGGRVVLSVPGPTPRLLTIMAEGLGKHIHPRCASFVEMVFSLHDGAQLRGLFERAGFSEIGVQVETRSLPLPEAEAFLWQYVHSTPLADPVAAATDDQRAAAAQEICHKWSDLMVDGSWAVPVRMSTVVAR